MSRLISIWILLIVLLLCAQAMLFAEQVQMDTKVVRVALFKNGLGYIVREGRLPNAQKIKLSPFSTPAHGTFWVSYPKEVNLTNLVAHEDSVMEAIPAITIPELLKANVGKHVILSTHWDDMQAISGKLLTVSDGRDEPELDPYAWGRSTPVGHSYGQRYRTTANLATIQTKEGVLAFDPGNVRKISVAEGEMSYSFYRKLPAWSLSLNLGRPAPGRTLAASYLAKGITWAPSYTVDISDPLKAKISAKALIINEAEDLDDVYVDLVTGFPNLQYADLLSPVAGKEQLSAFLSALGRGSSSRGRREGYSSVMTQSAPVMARPISGEYGYAMPEYGVAAAGKTVEDFFFYPLKKVNLAKGETGYFPLFSASIPYKQIYTWDIPDYISRDDRYSQSQERQEEVWHSLKITNTMQMPWTTAPAQTTKSGHILGQDTLNYVSPADETTLKITRSMGVKADQVEYEISRLRGEHAIHGHYYDKVKISGRLQVTNYKQEQIDLQITKLISGEVEKSSPQADIKSLARGLAKVNPSNELTWELSLQPGDTKEITYAYDVLIRR